MGAPIRHRKKYLSHKQRWNKETIEEEKKLVEDYALKNKKEIRKVEFLLSKLKRQAKEFNTSEENKTNQQVQSFLMKLKNIGFLPQEATSIDAVLDISPRDILERRLSNLVYKLKLARTPRQARQFVVHRHIRVFDKVIDAPSSIISLENEGQIRFRAESSLFDENHPEREIEISIESEIKDKKEEIEKQGIKDGKKVKDEKAKKEVEKQEVKKDVKDEKKEKDNVSAVTDTPKETEKGEKAKKEVEKQEVETEKKEEVEKQE